MKHRVTPISGVSPNESPWNFADSFDEGSCRLRDPRRRDVERFRRDGSRHYAALIDHCRTRGIRVIDLVESLGSGDARLDTLVSRHYTAAGNRVVAEAIWRYLEREGLSAQRTR